MTEKAPVFNRDELRSFLESNINRMMPVKAAIEGRFILKVPCLNDGKGPILLPNIKELEAKLRGSEGVVKTVELEAGPQKIPTDGTNVIVINRVDEFVQLALNAKLESLIDNANGEMTRDVIEEFMSYARGYSYNADPQQITFCKNAGFRNDVYNMPVTELKKRYVRHNRPDLSLDHVKDENIRSGYYMKKPILGYGVYLEGAFQSPLSLEAGGAVQEFEKGAMVFVPENKDLPISFIHVTDINTCYVMRDGSDIADEEGNHQLPSITVQEVLPKQAVTIHRKRPSPAAPA